MKVFCELLRAGDAVMGAAGSVQEQRYQLSRFAFWAAVLFEHKALFNIRFVGDSTKNQGWVNASVKICIGRGIPPFEPAFANSFFLCGLKN